VREKQRRTEMAQIQEFVDQVKGMTVLELNELVKALENEFGVSNRPKRRPSSMSSLRTLVTRRSTSSRSCAR